MAVDKTIKINVDTKEALQRLDAIEKELSDIKKTSKETSKGTSMLAKGFKGIGLAWKAIGIGAVIGALQFLAEKFSANQKILDSFNIGMAVFGDVLNQIGTVITSVVKGLGLLGKAVGKVLKGEFKEAGDLAKQSFDGVKDSIVGNNKSFKDFITNAKEAAKETVQFAKDLVGLQNEVKLAEANQRQLQLTYQKDAELQRQLRDDISLTFEERIAANTKLGEVLNEQFAKEQALANKKVQLAELELSRNKDNIDLQVALIDAKTELADLDERITGQRSEQLTNLKALEKEKADAELAAAKLISDTKKKEEAEAKELAKELNQLANERIDLAQSVFQSLADIAQQTLVKEKNALQEQLDAGLISQEEFDKETAAIEEEAIKREKRNALFQLLINSAQGVAAAIKAGSGLVWPANLAAIASGVATVLAGIASAKTILNKVPGGDGGDSGTDSVDVTSVGGFSGFGGLVPNIDAITPPGTTTQPVQAYVVENDISDAQALQEELDIQATL